MEQDTLSTIYIRLAMVAILVATLVGGYFYVTGLQDRVTSLSEQVQVAEKQRDDARQQVMDITQSKDVVVARQVEAEAAAAKLRADLARARGRVQTVVIPSKCDDALNWLAEELK